jgi:hypothetical protein
VQQDTTRLILDAYVFFALIILKHDYGDETKPHGLSKALHMLFALWMATSYLVSQSGLGWLATGHRTAVNVSLLTTFHLLPYRIQDYMPATSPQVIQEQGRIPRGIHGFPKVLLGPAMPYCFMPCKQPPLKQPFQEWPPTGKAACDHLITLLDTPSRAPLTQVIRGRTFHHVLIHIPMQNFCWHPDVRPGHGNILVIQ